MPHWQMCCCAGWLRPLAIAQQVAIPFKVKGWVQCLHWLLQQMHQLLPTYPSASRWHVLHHWYQVQNSSLCHPCPWKKLFIKSSPSLRCIAQKAFGQHVQGPQPIQAKPPKSIHKKHISIANEKDPAQVEICPPCTPIKQGHEVEAYLVDSQGETNEMPVYTKTEEEGKERHEEALEGAFCKKFKM